MFPQGTEHPKYGTHWSQELRERIRLTKVSRQKFQPLKRPPQIGDVQYGKDIGKKSQPSAHYQYLTCEECGKVKWVQLRKGVPLYNKCSKCSRETNELWLHPPKSTKDVSGENNPYYGKTHSPEIRARISNVKRKPRHNNNKDYHPQIGDIRYGDEINKLSHGSTQFIYQKCPDCNTTWWLRLRDYPKKCQRCCGKIQRNHSTKEPEIGEIRYGDEIGKRQPTTKYIWASCEICGINRWVRYIKKHINALKCPKCHMVGKILTKHIETRIRNIKATTEKTCPKCKNIYPATREYFEKHNHSILGIGSLCIDCYKNNLKESYHKQRQYFGKKINTAISSAIRDTLKGTKNGKQWQILVGYSLQDLIKHLERRFDSKMTWDNYGKKGWHIDHITPLAAFFYTSYDDPDFKRCWALDNLQPLWEKDNLSKNTKIVKPFQPRLDLLNKEHIIKTG